MSEGGRPANGGGTDDVRPPVAVDPSSAPADETVAVDAASAPADETVRNVLLAIAPATGAAFFHALVGRLSSEFGIECALVSRIDRADPGRAQTVAVACRGRPAADMSYALEGTPCAHVLRGSLCHYPGGVREAFPEDHLLAEMGVESYMGVPLFSAAGRPAGILAVLHDRPLPAADRIAEVLRAVAARAGAELEREVADEELRESRARLAAVIEHSPGVAVQWYDRDGRVLLWNRASEEMFGFSAVEAVGRTLDELILAPEAYAAFLRALDEIARTGAPCGPAEYPFRHRSGATGVSLSTTFRIPGEAGRDWFVCMDVDLTERKRAEEERIRLEAEVLQAQKLESLGILAGGIAHDFNNLLTSMLGHASLARAELAPGSRAREHVEEVERAAQRAAELTQQMLAYSGRGKFVTRRLRLDEVVGEMRMLLQTAVSRKAEFRLDLGRAVIEGDPTRIRQVVMNLLTNASDALGSEPGEIRLRTGVREFAAPGLRTTIVDRELPPGRYALLEVGDTGCGMDAATLGRIFEPFFTTKFTGRGLGLAAVLGIVRSHGGTLDVETAPGAGTTFRVYFPAVEDTDAAEEPEPEPTVAVRGRGLVLVVDDEQVVRKYARVVLEQGGFEVLDAGDGPHAIEAFRARADDVRLVLLDLTMPLMDGWELLARLRELRPALPALLMSGYDEPDVPARWAGLRAPAFLHKPFRPEDLLGQVVRATEDADGASASGPAATG